MAEFIDYEVVINHYAVLSQNRFQTGFDERVEHHQRVAAVVQIFFDRFDFFGQQPCLWSGDNKDCAMRERLVSPHHSGFFDNIIQCFETVPRFCHAVRFVDHDF